MTLYMELAVHCSIQILLSYSQNLIGLKLYTDETPDTCRNPLRRTPGHGRDNLFH